MVKYTHCDSVDLRLAAFRRWIGRPAPHGGSRVVLVAALMSLATRSKVHERRRQRRQSRRERDATERRGATAQLNLSPDGRGASLSNHAEARNLSEELFKLVDKDGSGHIAFEELESVSRKQLGMSLSELPDASIKCLWCSLDADDSSALGQFVPNVAMAARAIFQQKVHLVAHVAYARLLHEFELFEHVVRQRVR